MKIIEFIRWKWQKTTIGDYFYWSGLASITIGLIVQEPYQSYLIGVGISIWFVAMVKFFIVEKLKREYNTFIQERRSLFNTIKNSDQNQNEN